MLDQAGQDNVEESKSSKVQEGSDSLSVIRLTPADFINAPKNENQMLKKAFEDAISKQPSILWIEEVDYIAKNKSLFYGFLAALDSFESNQSLVIATTSKLNEVDKSLRRGGRLDLDVIFEMPSTEDRFEILKTHLATIDDCKINDEELDMVAKAASGFVSSDLGQIVRNAHLLALKEKEEEITLTKSHLEQAVIAAKPLSI